MSLTAICSELVLLPFPHFEVEPSLAGSVDGHDRYHTLLRDWAHQNVNVFSAQLREAGI